MANLTETNRWEAGIYQLETSDPVMGGPNGIDNRAPRELANRTLWLKTELAKPAAQDDTLSELLELINCQLTEKGLKIEKASAAVVDATIIQTAGSKQRQAIEVDEEGQVSGQTTPSKDSDARWIKKNASTNSVTNNIPVPMRKAILRNCTLPLPMPMNANTCRLCWKAYPKVRPSMPTKATTVRKTGNI